MCTSGARSQILKVIKFLSETADESMNATPFDNLKYVYPENFDEIIANNKLLVTSKLLVIVKLAVL